MQLSALCRGGVTVRCEQRMRPPTQAVLFRRENGLSHGLNKVKGTSQPGWLPSPRVPLLHRTKDTPVPTATPTLTELATIAHTHRCSVVATHHRRVLLDDTASPLPFLGVRFGPAVKAVAARIGPADHRAIVVAVNRSGEAIAYDPTTDRIESDVRRLTALDPARRTLGLATRPCRRPVWALANLVWLDRVLAAALDAPLGEPPHWLELRRLHPWPKRGHRRVRKCSLITHGTSPRCGRCFVPVQSRARSPGHRFVRRWPRGSTRGRSLVTALCHCPISTSSRLICTSCSGRRGGGECSPGSLGRDKR